MAKRSTNEPNGKCIYRYIVTLNSYLWQSGVTAGFSGILQHNKTGNVSVFNHHVANGSSMCLNLLWFTASRRDDQTAITQTDWCLFKWRSDKSYTRHSVAACSEHTEAHVWCMHTHKNNNNNINKKAQTACRRTRIWLRSCSASCRNCSSSLIVSLMGHALLQTPTTLGKHTHANSHAHTHTRTLYQLTPARKTEETLLGWRMGNKHKYPVWVHTKEEGAAEGGAGRSSKGGLALQTPSSVWFKRPSEPGSDLYWLNQPFVLLHCTGCSARSLCFCVECALLCTVGRSGLSIW